MDAGGEFRVVVVPSTPGGVDLRPLLAAADEQLDAPLAASSAGAVDFSDIEPLDVVLVRGSDRSGNRIVRIVGKNFPATIIDAENLKKYVLHKLSSEVPDGPFCILYMHTTVQSAENNPGMSVLRGIYEALPLDFKERLKIVYFLHPGLRSRLALATLGRFFLSNSLYWKIKYVSRLEYLWEDIKKSEVEIPDFVVQHDRVLEERPLTDYGIEPDPFHLSELPGLGYSVGRFENKWSSQDYM